MKLINHINFKVRICYEVSQYSRSIDQLFQFLTCPLKYYNWPQMWGTYKIGLELLTELIKIEMWFRRQLSSSVSRVLLSSQQIQQKCTLSNQNFSKIREIKSCCFFLYDWFVHKTVTSAKCLPFINALLINFGAYNFVIKNSTILAKNEEKTIIHILFPSRTKFQFFVPKCNDPYNLPNVKHTRELFQTSLLSFQYWLCEKLLLETPRLRTTTSTASAAGVG